MKGNIIYRICQVIDEFIHRQKDKTYHYLRNYVINHEIERFKDRVYYDDYTSVKLIKSNPNYWVFSPTEVVIYVLKMHFNSRPNSLFQLGIFSIEVNTQDETVDVTINLKRPGLLIGKAGKDFNEIRDKLREVFNMPTQIHINEIKKDMNEPVICY